MNYKIGDRVRLAKVYGGIEYDGSGPIERWVFPGDVGMIIGHGYGPDYPWVVHFDGKKSLTLALDEMEPA